MSQTTQRFPAPRVETEDLPAPRLEPELALIEPALPKEGRRWGFAALVTGGVSVLLLGLAGVESVDIVTDAFVRSPFWEVLRLAWLVSDSR